MSTSRWQHEDVLGQVIFLDRRRVLKYCYNRGNRMDALAKLTLQGSGPLAAVITSRPTPYRNAVILVMSDGLTALVAASSLPWLSTDSTQERFRQ
jgi:hypothetical protein